MLDTKRLQLCTLKVHSDMRQAMTQARAKLVTGPGSEAKHSSLLFNVCQVRLRFVETVGSPQINVLRAA